MQIKQPHTVVVESLIHGIFKPLLRDSREQRKHVRKREGVGSGNEHRLHFNLGLQRDMDLHKSRSVWANCFTANPDCTGRTNRLQGLTLWSHTHSVPSRNHSLKWSKSAWRKKTDLLQNVCYPANYFWKPFSLFKRLSWIRPRVLWLCKNVANILTLSTSLSLHPWHKYNRLLSSQENP